MSAARWPALAVAFNTTVALEESSTKPEWENVAYEAMTRAGLAGHLAGRNDEMTRWKYVWEFLEEYRWEPAARRPQLFQDEPASTADELAPETTELEGAILLQCRCARGVVSGT